MHIKTIPCGPLDVNSYVLYEEANGTCAVIDPADAEPVLLFLDSQRLTCSHILLTHGHFDHIGGVAALAQCTGAKICIHKSDAHMLLSDAASLAALGNYHIQPSNADILLNEGDNIQIAGREIQVLHTPGHTPGGVCYLIKQERALFTGDTIFRLGAGRADFPGSDEVALYRSIVYKLFELPGNYTLYPGHMRTTTLDFERERNPFVRHYKQYQW